MTAEEITGESAAERARVVAVARTWLRTPYVAQARVKGAGVDCAMLLAEVFQEAAIVGAFDVPHYPPDWHLHQDAERYIGQILDLGAREVAAAKPGDVAVWKVGRTFSHGAIVVDWPLVIESRLGVGVILSDMEREQFFAVRPRRFFTLWDD